jgi:hypothetical protein
MFPPSLAGGRMKEGARKNDKEPAIRYLRKPLIRFNSLGGAVQMTSCNRKSALALKGCHTLSRRSPAGRCLRRIQRYRRQNAPRP